MPEKQRTLEPGSIKRSMKPSSQIRGVHPKSKHCTGKTVRKQIPGMTIAIGEPKQSLVQEKDLKGKPGGLRKKRMQNKKRSD